MAGQHYHPDFDSCYETRLPVSLVLLDTRFAFLYVPIAFQNVLSFPGYCGDNCENGDAAVAAAVAVSLVLQLD